MKNITIDPQSIYNLSYKTIMDLSSEEGIYASSRNESFGCIFGRDSAITILKILKVHQRKSDPLLLEISKRTLQTLLSLQGKEVNIESGEEPGKIVHEYRKSNYERLLKLPKPWYVYPEGVLKNYDSVDSTPLFLIAFYKYVQVTGDTQLLQDNLVKIKNALDWIINFGDKNGDLMMDYQIPEERISGGLPVQSWSDSMSALLQPDGVFPEYPIAPVEVQAVAFWALKTWGNFFASIDPLYSRKLESFAYKMKKSFNKKFIFKDGEYYFAAQALDGKKKKIKTVTANPLLCLWASFIDEKTNKKECIIQEKYMPDIVSRGMLPDMFDESAGIRTMSTLSKTFDPSSSSYHNGSFWPMINGLIYEGFVNWGYLKEARAIYEATLRPIAHFNSPIELFIMSPEGNLVEYKSDDGHGGCKFQAWTAASLLEMITHQNYS